MKPPIPGWEAITTTQVVYIPTLEGTVAEAIEVKVPAWRDPQTGDEFLDGHAEAIIEQEKARRIGLLPPARIKALRERLGLTQKALSELLQIGLKTWTRWETGKERPSRSMNVLLCALEDGKIDLIYLRQLREPDHCALRTWAVDPKAGEKRCTHYPTKDIDGHAHAISA